MPTVCGMPAVRKESGPLAAKAAMHPTVNDIHPACNHMAVSRNWGSFLQLSLG